MQNDPQTASQNPPERKRQSNLSSVQVTFAAIVAIGLILAINFRNRIAADQSLREVQEKVLQEIDLLRREQADLIQELNFVRSDAFVESWAHDEGKMVREGEVLVIPAPAAILVTQTPEPPTLILETTPPQPDNWMLWWSLFFDSDPPEF